MTGSASTVPIMKGVTFTQVAKSVEKHLIVTSTFEPPPAIRKWRVPNKMEPALISRRLWQK